MTSHEKIARLRAELAAPGQPGEEPGREMLRTAAAFLGPMLDLMLPADPGELDEALEWCANQALSLRSDPVEAAA